MAALERTVAKLQSFVQQLPELCHIAARREGNVGKIDGDNALIEPAPVFRFTFGIEIRSQEGAASHAAVNITIVIGVYFVTAHDLGGNVVRHQSFGGTLGGQHRQIPVRRLLGNVVFVQHIQELRECRSDIVPRLILEPKDTLSQELLDEQRSFLLVFRIIIEVHKYAQERCLPVGIGHAVDLIIEGLNSIGDFLLCVLHRPAIRLSVRHTPAEVLASMPLTTISNKRSQMRKVDGGAAIGRTGHSSDNLRGNRSRSDQSMRLVDLNAVDNRTVLKHVLQIDELAVVKTQLSVIVGVMKVNDAFVVRLDNILGQQEPPGDVRTCNASDVVPLGRHHLRVFVTILGFPVFVLTIQQFLNGLVGGVALPNQLMLVAVLHILRGDILVLACHQLADDDVLDLLHGQVLLAGLDIVSDFCAESVCILRQFIGVHLNERLGNGFDDLTAVEFDLAAISLGNCHSAPSSQ